MSVPFEWMTSAACAQTDPDLFFLGKGGSSVKAKAICRGCSVISSCRTWGLSDKNLKGIIGGMTERERRAIRAEDAA